MTRSYGRIKTSIWSDDDFRQLGDAAQALYMRLLSAPTMNLCGVCDWRPKRIALYTRGMSADKVQKTARELADNRYVLVDEESDEVLVRTFIRHEKVIDNPKTAAGAEAAFAAIASPNLRAAVAYELRRLRAELPDLKGWDHVPNALRYRLDWLPHWVSDRQSDRVSDSLSGRVSDHVPIPLEPRTERLEPEPEPFVDATPSTRKRGTRLPDGWMPRRELIAQIKTECPNVDPEAEHRIFTDFWKSKSGKDATKLDWEATWRNWMRNANRRLTTSRPTRQQESDDQFARMMERATEIDQQKTLQP